MAWAVPLHTKKQVDDAGRALGCVGTSLTERNSALDVVGNWRAIHAFPLNTFSTGLRTRASAVYEGALVAQRLKRLSSIEFKLNRFPKMNLSRMQDIGGCRAVLRSPAQVRRLVLDYKKSRIKHQLVGEKDYISEPKESGYRGIHLIYRYLSDKKDTYNGLQIEIQIRSRLQHAWATAVETVGTFLEHSLKSSMGPADWLKFFTLSSSAFARVERSPVVPGTPEAKEDLLREIEEMKRTLDVEKQLKVFGRALKITEDGSPKDSHFFLLLLVPGGLRIHSYRKDEISEATEKYLELEKINEGVTGAQVVLVAAESLKMLRRAYPNYYLDAQVFLDELSRAIQK